MFTLLQQVHHDSGLIIRGVLFGNGETASLSAADLTLAASQEHRDVANGYQSFGKPLGELR